jgi:tartrate-resistant acid phosphatase type 5
VSAARAAALVATAALAACGCRSPTFTYRAPRALAPPAPPPVEAPSQRFLHLADFGDATCQQGKVTDAVEAAHRRAPFHAALFPGDLVYECGPDADAAGADACRFAPDANTVEPGLPPGTAAASFRVHEEPLAFLAQSPAVPVYVSLGNHDVAAWGSCAGEGDPVERSRRKACLNVAHASPLWTMPGRHYPVDLGPARILAIDSNLLLGDYGGFSFEDEVAFVRDAAAGCRADACEAEPGGCDRPWCFVLAHHPAFTAGGHRDDATPEYLARVSRLLEAGGGRLRGWLSGHDHDLQHVRGPGGLDVFVSGNGARGRPRERFREVSAPGAEVLFGSVAWGFGVLEVSRGGWRYRFEDVDGVALYCCAATGAGRCEPTRCE